MIFEYPLYLVGISRELGMVSGWNLVEIYIYINRVKFVCLIANMLKSGWGNPQMQLGYSLKK